MLSLSSLYFFFFFNDTATTEIYTLSLHDALPISQSFPSPSNLFTFNPANQIYISHFGRVFVRACRAPERSEACNDARSEEHTSELQSRLHLVCRLLLEKKK